MKFEIVARTQKEVVAVTNCTLNNTDKESFNNFIEVLRSFFNCIIKNKNYDPKILYSIEFECTNNNVMRTLLKMLNKHDVDAAYNKKNYKLNSHASKIFKYYFKMHLESCVEVVIMRIMQQFNNNCEIFIIDEKPHFKMTKCTMTLKQIDAILTKIHNEYISSWFEQEVKLSLYVSIFKNFDRNCKDKHSIFKVITILNEIIELQEMTGIIYIEDTNVIDTFLTVLITTMIKELRHKTISEEVRDVCEKIKYNEQGEQELTNISQLTKILHKTFPMLQPILSDEQNKMLIRCTARYIIDKDYEFAQMIANIYYKLKE